MALKYIKEKPHIGFIVVGAILIISPFLKAVIENSGLSRANTFGYIQLTLLIVGLLTLASGLSLVPGERQKGYRYLCGLLISIFIILVAIKAPMMWNAVEEADISAGQKIFTYGDDVEYQIMAVNMINRLGFSPAISLPLDTYHLDLDSIYGREILEDIKSNPKKLLNEDGRFYRPPGFPVVMAASYALFGNETIVARRLTVIFAILTALILLLLGAFMAGWIGILAGGIAGLYHIYYYPGIFDYKYVLTETPSAFYVALFCLFFVLYQKKGKALYLYLASFSFTVLGLTRPNFYLTFPFLALYLLYKKEGLKTIAIFTLVMALPAAAWSAYASANMGKLVIVTTQGGTLIPPHNNIDVLEGVGPDHSGQGGPQFGRIEDAQGRLIEKRYSPKPGENGWLIGLKFWVDNFEELPRLFYVKLRRGFFYDNHWSVNILHPEGLYLTGLGFLLMSIGFRPPRRDIQPCLLKTLSSKQILIIQLALICFLFLIWNQVAFWLVALVWFAIALLAIKRPYGDFYQFPFPSQAFFLATITCHAITTMLYQGYRYHWPLDPILIFYSLTGISLTLFELSKSSIKYAFIFLAVLGATLALHFFGLWA